MPGCWMLVLYHLIIPGVFQGKFNHKHTYTHSACFCHRTHRNIFSAEFSFIEILLGRELNKTFKFAKFMLRTKYIYFFK